MKKIAAIAQTMTWGGGTGVMVPVIEEQDEITPVSIKDLDTGWHPKVGEAVQAAYEWVERKRVHPNASLVLVASQQYKPDPDDNSKNPRMIPDENATGYGVGKTHIAESILWASSTRVVEGDRVGDVVSHTGKFFKAKDLIGRLGKEQPRDLVRMPAEVYPGSELYGTHALVIDDVGTEGVIEYVSAVSQEKERQSRYFQIIDYCYGGFISGRRNGISVIITANLTLDNLAAHIGGRAWSRLLEMAPSGFMVDLTGVPDYRRNLGGR